MRSATVAKRSSGDFARQRRTICDSAVNLCIHLRKIRRLQRQDRVQGRERAVPRERPVAGEHFVEHGTEREDVRTSSTGSPRTCSGAMYPAVPAASDRAVSGGEFRRR